MMGRRRDLRSALFALIIAIPALATAGGFDGIYTLGDSLSDQGNLFDATDSLTGSGIPRADYYDSGRFTNGENWVDVLVGQLGVISVPSLYGGNNFAYGGTRTDYNTVEENGCKPVPVGFLPNQGDAFPCPDGQPLFPWTLNAQREAFNLVGVNEPGALYVVFSGSNDLVDITLMAAFGLLVIEDVPTWIGDVIIGINGAIEAMVDAGAQDILVPNIPNLGVVPGFTGDPNLAGLATYLTVQYNEALVMMLATWEDDVNIIPFNTFELTNDVTDDPESYGFTNATTACYNGFVAPVPGEEITECDNPDEHVFWDREHPTAAFHALLAQSALATFVPDMLDYLTLQVSKLDIKDKVRNSLNKKLDSASQKLAKGKSADAAAKLQAFIEKVEAKQGKTIPEDEAASMIMRADKIIALLDAGH